jgi:putative ABC transport system permease protein
VVGVAEPELTGEVAAAIDKGFRNSLAETLTETEKAFQQGFVAMTGAIISTIEVVSIMVIVIILAVVANTMAMTTRERIGEYAVLKTLGFKASHIAGLIFGEYLVITTLGCLLGMTLTYPAADVFYRQLGAYFPVFNVEEETLLLSMIASVLVGLAAASFPRTGQKSALQRVQEDRVMAIPFLQYPKPLDPALDHGPHPLRHGPRGFRVRVDSHAGTRPGANPG